MRLADFAILKDSNIDFASVESRCRWKKFDQNEILVDFDDPSTDVYFLISGDVRILMRTAAGKEVILNEMRGGQLFGELAAVDSVKRSANVTALTRGEVCIMPASIFKDILYNTPMVAERMFRILTTRIRELNARLVEHTVLDLRHRLYSELLRMSVPRHGHEGQKVVTPPPYHHVLAGRIGCRREQVTREFSTMTQEGLIERTRGALILMKPEVMQSRVSEALREDG